MSKSSKKGRKYKQVYGTFTPITKVTSQSLRNEMLILEL